MTRLCADCTRPAACVNDGECHYTRRPFTQPERHLMSTGARIVEELKEAANTTEMGFVIHRNKDLIYAALLAYEPKSALRTILERAAESTGEGNYVHFPADLVEAARAELDRLEVK